MTGVALLDRSFDQASAPESCGESRLPATSVAQKSCHHELFGLAHGRLSADQLAQLRTGRGYANLSLGNASAAIADFDRSIELFPNNVPALRWRGRAFEQSGQLDKARADYDRVLVLRPNDEWALERMQQLRGK
jgi:tetratricopeptide (TPR) repeat protein